VLPGATASKKNDAGCGGSNCGENKVDLQKRAQRTALTGDRHAIYMIVNRERERVTQRKEPSIISVPGSRPFPTRKNGGDFWGKPLLF